MLNFGTNFLFYTVCSKTSRNELYLIMYYYGYWIWSENYKKFPICNHPNHNKHIDIHDRNRENTLHRLTNETEPKSNVINMKNNKKSRLKIHCFLLNAKRLRTLCVYESIKNNQEKSIKSKTQTKSEKQNVYITDKIQMKQSKSIVNKNETLLEKES